MFQSSLHKRKNNIIIFYLIDFFHAKHVCLSAKITMTFCVKCIYIIRKFGKLPYNIKKLCTTLAQRLVISLLLIIQSNMYTLSVLAPNLIGCCGVIKPILSSTLDNIYLFYYSYLVCSCQYLCFLSFVFSRKSPPKGWFVY